MKIFLAAATAVLIAGIGSAASAADQQAYAVAMHTANDQGPPPAQHPQDPADSLYRAARAALNSGDYRRAAELFERITERHPRSSYAPDALYWEAFARYRTGRTEELRTALEALATQREQHPRAATRRDADALATRIRGELARQGDARAAQSVVRDANRAAARPARPPEPPRPATRPAERRSTACAGDNNDTRIAALNALLQMDAAQAVPILQQVLARRDECSAPLREKAVFLISQKQSPETESTLLSVARNDPSPNVREQAVFWLSQVPGDRAVGVLEEILRTSTDNGVREKALFALSQHRSDRAWQILRGVAEQANAPADLREKAIFWIGQKPSGENAAFLRDLYGQLTNPELKEKVLFSLSQMSGQGNDRWLMDVALNQRQPVEMRKKALFWASQGGGTSISQLVDLYGRMPDPEMKEQLIFAYSQRREPAAVDKLIDIARNERNGELREKAIFWLGQSKDPRAARVLVELINQ